MSRRTVTVGAAWVVPAVAVAGTAPAFAGSVPGEGPGGCTVMNLGAYPPYVERTEADVRERFAAVVDHPGFAEPIYTREPSLTVPYDQGELSPSYRDAMTTAAN